MAHASLRGSRARLRSLSLPVRSHRHGGRRSHRGGHRGAAARGRPRVPLARMLGAKAVPENAPGARAYRAAARVRHRRASVGHHHLPNVRVLFVQGDGPSVGCGAEVRWLPCPDSTQLPPKSLAANSWCHSL